MNIKIMDVIATACMGLGGLALGGFLVLNHQVAIGSALIGAVSSAWFLHNTTTSTIGTLLQTVAGSSTSATAAKPPSTGSSL